MEQTERKESGTNGRLSLLRALVPSVPEIRRLLAALVLEHAPARQFVLAWSLWRRRHQADAAAAHYRRRERVYIIQTQLEY